MRISIRRSRGLVIAIAALAVSATIVFAAQPTSTPSPASSGLGKAATHSGKTVPVQTGQGAPTTQEDASDQAADCSVDPSGLTTDQLNLMSHGSIVCGAAHAATPAGYANHGAFVSHFAHWGNTHAAAGLAHKAQGTDNKP